MENVLPDQVLVGGDGVMCRFGPHYKTVYILGPERTEHQLALCALCD